MVDLNVIRVTWTGINGMPGVSTFYREGDVTSFTPKLTTFFGSIANYVPSGITWSVPSSGVVIDSATGLAKASWIGPVQTPVTSSATGGYAGPGGAVIQYETGLFLEGRRLRGKTFVVPINGTNFGTNGQLTSGCITALTNAATTMSTGAAGLSVYSRMHKVVGAVTSAKCLTKVGVLRTRRD